MLNIVFQWMVHMSQQCVMTHSVITTDSLFRCSMTLQLTGIIP